MPNPVKIYHKFVSQIIKSDRMTAALLFYLKISLVARKRAGRFSRKELVLTAQTSHVTAKKYIDLMIEYGWIKRLSKDTFQITGQIRLFDRAKKINRYWVMSEDDLMKYSWRNIASFRAYLEEIVYTTAEIQKRAKIKGYLITDQRSGQKTKIQDRTLIGFDNLTSLSLASELVGRAISTIHKHRRLQKVAKYNQTFCRVSIPKAKDCPAWLLPDLLQDLGESRDEIVFFEPVRIKKGAFFKFKGSFYFSGISERFLINPINNISQTFQK